MLAGLKHVIIEKGSYAGYLGLILLVIIALMNIVHNITYLRPTDGAVWEERDGVIVVVDTDLSVDTIFQVGDELRRIDDEQMDSILHYNDYLYEEMSIGSRHLYSLNRGGDRFEPWVEIRGIKDTNWEIYVYAATGFIYLMFLFMMLNKNVSLNHKRALVFFCFTVFLRYVFHYTARFSTLDWISYFLVQVGAILLPSGLAALALKQSLARTRWLPFAQAIHWIPTLVLLAMTLAWFGQLGGLLPFVMDEEFIFTIERLRGLWSGGLILLAVLLLILVAEMGRREKNFSIYWAIAWLPYALISWRLDYPFADAAAGAAPLVLPVAWLLEWRSRAELDLGSWGKKIAVYFSVVFVLLVGYFLFLTLFRLLLGAEIGQDGQVIVLGIGIMFAAVSYSPLYHFFAEQWDRLLYGARYGAMRVLLDVSGINRADTDIDRFLEIILNRVKNAFIAESGLVYTAVTDQDFHTISGIKPEAAFSFEEVPPALLDGQIIRGSAARAIPLDDRRGSAFHGTDYICPIRVTGRLAALIVLSPEGGGNLSPEELRLLESLLHQCDVLMENMELYRSLQQKAQSINQLKEYNDNIIESSRIGILTTDEMGKAVSSNSALGEMAGMDKDQVMGLTFEELFHSKDVKVQRQVKAGFAMEGTFETHQGEALILGIEKTPLKTKEQVVYGTLYLIEDIRERKQMDQQLMQQEKLASIGLLAAGVAHEINTPLTGITSYAQLMVADEGLDEEQKELLDLIMDQSKRAANIVTELLHFSRKESAPKGPVNLMEVLNQTLRFLSHQIQKRRVQVTVHEPKEPPMIDGYPNQIQQVFVNLIVNAMDAMNGGGSLDIRVVTTSRRITMWFSDTGTGMDAETRGHLFDPFFTTKEAGKGTGLGMSVVYRILRDHEGIITVSSEVGQGTTFKLDFHPSGVRPVSMWHSPPMPM